MANIDSSSDGNNFDNGFEKLGQDDLGPNLSNQDTEMSSGSAHQEDLISSTDNKERNENILLDHPSATTDSVGTCSCLRNIDPRVLELIYWRDLKKTGVVFGSMMVLLLSLAMFSVLSVIAYLSLAALSVTFSFRVYKNILGAVQKSGEGHPFKQYFDVEIQISEEKVHQAAEVSVKHFTNTIKELRHLFLIGDLVDSLKFILLLWVFTYIGAWFNGMTLILLATVAIFTLPKVYETHKEKIDQFAGLACNKVKLVFKQLQDKLPLPGKKKKQ